MEWRNMMFLVISWWVWLELGNCMTHWGSQNFAEQAKIIQESHPSSPPPCQTWNLSKILYRRIFRPKILHRQFHLISTVLVIKTQKNEWKWRNLHRWQKFYTAASGDGMDKFHLCQHGHNKNFPPATAICCEWMINIK